MVITYEIKEVIKVITHEPNEKYIERIKDFFEYDEDNELTSVSGLRRRLIFLLYNYEEMYEKIITKNKTSSLSIHDVAYRAQRERDNLQREKNNLERERNEWRTKFNNKNRENEDYKGKYEDAIRELDRLKNKMLSENEKNTDEKLKQKDKDLLSENKIARLEEKLESKSSQLIEVVKQIENTKKELNIVHKEKENQAIMFENKLDQKSALLETVRQSLKDLEIKSEREKGEKTAEVKEKDGELKEKKEELKRKEEEVKKSQKEAGQSREKLLTKKINLKYGKLEIFANQIGINLQQVSDLCRYCERLVQAQKNYNQANIETHENNITRVREGLRQDGVQIEDIQKFCNKCEKIAKMRFELNEIRRQYQQYEAQQEIPPRNNRIN